jgi:predicted nucleic acid-binding protein
VDVTGVLDTNIVVSLLGGHLAQPLAAGAYAVSVITEMELLSYPTLQPAEEAAVRQFLANVSVVEMGPPVRTLAVGLRRAHKLKLPDAVVAATALHIGCDLLTNDERLAKTPGIRAIRIPTK